MNRRIQLTLKRAFNIVVSLTVLTLLSPLIALAIKLDGGGPAFYVQERAGKGSETFRCYKFRFNNQGRPIEGNQARSRR